MKKHLVMSPLRCECGRPIKASVAARKLHRPLTCFACYQKASLDTSNPIRTARDIRTHPHLRSLKRNSLPLRSAKSLY